MTHPTKVQLGFNFFRMLYLNENFFLFAQLSFISSVICQFFKALLPSCLRMPLFDRAIYRYEYEPISSKNEGRQSQSHLRQLSSYTRSYITSGTQEGGLLSP